MIAGASSDARDAWAAERVEEGVSSKCCYAISISFSLLSIGLFVMKNSCRIVD